MTRPRLRNVQQDRDPRVCVFCGTAKCGCSHCYGFINCASCAEDFKRTRRRFDIAPKSDALASLRLRLLHKSGFSAAGLTRKRSRRMRDR